MADPLPVIISFHADDLPPAQRFSAWEQLSIDTHTITRPAADVPFYGDAFICSFGDLVLSHARYAQQVFSRSPQHIRRDHLDHFGLFAQGDGTRTLAFGPDGREQIAYPGDLILFDMQQPGDSLASNGSSGTVYLPRPLIEAAIPAASSQHGAVISGPIARLVAEHIHVIGGHMMRDETATSADPPGSSPSYHRLVRSTRELAISCLLDTFADVRASTVDVDAASVVRDDALRGAIVHYIDAHLTDPDLEVRTLCAAFTLSRSSLYRLFAEPGDDGIARLIKQRRLSRIRAIILANQDRRPLANIAADYGFRSAAHFSREFRAVFGYAPGELRQMDGDHSLRLAKRATAIDSLFYALSVA
ncbi:MAG: helix-turn-helix domain-containing protein [Thermomicrobiales bacterium]